MNIVLATSNRGKFSEFEDLLKPLGVSVVSQDDYGVTSPEETGKSFIENALIKARHATSLTNVPSLADDSGLVVRALDGKPGVRSARYAGEHSTDERNVTKLLETMREVSDGYRQCEFICALVYLRFEDDPTPIVATGSWSGFVLRAPQGLNGFGYDPVFGVLGTDKSAAQLNSVAKNKRSHRGAAVANLLPLLERELKE